jgi:hypothetical protein
MSIRLDGVHPAYIPRVFFRDNYPSRTCPAGGRRKLPLAPDDPRNGSVGKTCYRRKSPPAPAQPGTTKTGLSRRRSRVRVPSLPLKIPCKRASFVA